MEKDYPFRLRVGLCFRRFPFANRYAYMVIVKDVHIGNVYPTVAGLSWMFSPHCCDAARPAVGRTRVEAVRAGYRFEGGDPDG